jgi:hypothetical protein
MEGGQPGWFVPEQYGITPSSLFCSHYEEIWHVSNVLNKPLGMLYYPPSQYPNEFINGAYYNLLGDFVGSFSPGNNGMMIPTQGNVAMEVTSASNPHQNPTFPQSLSFSNNNTLVITLPEESAEIELWLSTAAQGVTIKYYKSEFSLTNIFQNYILIDAVYKSQNDLNLKIEYDCQNYQNQFVSKIEIVPDNVNQAAIDAINAQIDLIWANATSNTNGAVNSVILNAQELAEYDALVEELNTIISSSCNQKECETDWVICEFLQGLIINLNACVSYSVPNLFYDNWSCFLDVITGIQNFDKQYPQYNLYSQLINDINNLQNYPNIAVPPTLSGALLEVQIIFDQISQIGDCDCEGNEITSCKTSLQQVKWKTVLDYQTEQTIPSQPAIQADYQLMVDALTNHIQPIWKPNTAFCIHVKLKDNVNDGQSPGKIWDYVYGFRTAGPLGHFEKRVTDYIKADMIPEEYPITSLKSYIDMKRSYPNADGNLLGSKPLFYGHEQCTLQIFFTKPYVYHMFKTWEVYQGQSEKEGSINIAIKDPVSQEIIPYPLPSSWTQNPPNSVPISSSATPNTPTWSGDNDPNLPLSIQQLNSFITASNSSNSSVQCTIALGNPIKPLAYSYMVTLTNLKPSKLYTALIYNAFDDNQDGNYNPHLVANKIDYEENQKVHEYVFKTSRYADFEEQINSYLLKELDDAGNLVEERDAIYEVQLTLTQQQIDDSYKVLTGSGTSVLLDGISNTYTDSFDKVVEGIWGLKPMDAPNFTEFIKVVNQNNEVIAMVIRNPEPFNDPRIPVEINIDNLEVVDASGGNLLAYKKLFSKDYSQVIVMHESKKITQQLLNFNFKYLLWDGSTYQEEDSVLVNNIIVNN